MEPSSVAQPENAGGAAEPVSSPPPATAALQESNQSATRIHIHRLLRTGAPKWIEALSAVALVVITFFYAHYAKQQRDAMQDSNKINQQSAAAATMAAQAAKDSAAIARSTLESAQQQFRTEQRPYLMATATSTAPGGGLAMQSVGSDTYVQVAVVVRNSGRSPAIEVVATPSLIKFGPTKELAEQARTFVPEFHRVAGGTIAPDTNLTLITPSPPKLSSEEMQHVRDGSWTVFVLGAVEYRDIFNPQISPYETDFCFVVRTDGLPFGNCSFSNRAK